MKEQLISLETALLAKEKGFPQKIGLGWNRHYYNHLGELDGDVSEYLKRMIKKEDTTGLDSISAPTQSLLQKWLRDEHHVYITVERCVIGSDEWEFGYFIEWLPKENHEEKRRVGFFKDKRSLVDNYPYHYLGAWHSYEEALEAGLVEGLKLV